MRTSRLLLFDGNATADSKVKSACVPGARPEQESPHTQTSRLIAHREISPFALDELRFDIAQAEKGRGKV